MVVDIICSAFNIISNEMNKYNFFTTLIILVLIGQMFSSWRQIPIRVWL